jgi:hypothetical protein
MPVIDAIPANQYLDPVMDTAIGSMPIWFIVLIVITMILVFTNLWWIFKRSRMYPVLGYLDALRAGQPQTIFIGKNRALLIKYLEYIDGVLAYKDVGQIAKWLVQSPKSVGRLGGLSTILVRDNYDYSVDPVAEIAICTLAKEWNKKYGDDNPMNSYNDFVRLRDSGELENEYPIGISIPVYNIYDPSLIQKFLPSGRSAGIFGSHLTSKAKELRSDKTQEKWYEKYLPIGAAISVSILMLVLSFMFATGG